MQTPVESGGYRSPEISGSCSHILVSFICVTVNLLISGDW